MYVTDSAIIFEESVGGFVRYLYREYWRSECWWRKAVFVGWVFAPLYATVWLGYLILRGDFLLVTAVPAAIAALKLTDLVRGFRSPDEIPLEAIEAVSMTAGTKALTRPRLVITYTEGDTTYRRRVPLPSRYTVGGDETYRRARELFERRGLTTR